MTTFTRELEETKRNVDLFIKYNDVKTFKIFLINLFFNIKFLLNSFSCKLILS